MSQAGPQPVHSHYDFSCLIALFSIYIAVKFVIWVVKKLMEIVKRLKGKLTKHGNLSIDHVETA